MNNHNTAQACSDYAIKIARKASTHVNRRNIANMLAWAPQLCTLSCLFLMRLFEQQADVKPGLDG